MGRAASHSTDGFSDAGARIGVFGGTFDPLHVGHLMIAMEVRHALMLDRLLFVVANDPWQKADSGVTRAEHRLSLAKAGVAEMNERIGDDALEVSDAEIVRGGESYSADTLEELHRELPDAELFLLVGSDAAEGLPTWKRPDAVRDLATTVVVERGGREGGRPPVGWAHVVVEVPLMEVSSSDLRARFADGRPVEALVPPTVVAGVRQLGLYGPPA